MFELVFEGPVDESAETLRVLKGVFISDLEMSVDQVREILAHAPITIKQSDDRSELERNQGALEKAGGKVLIVQPDFGEDDTEDDQVAEMSFEFEFDSNGDISNGTDRKSHRSVLEPNIENPDPPPSSDEIDSLLAQLDNQKILEKPEPIPLIERFAQQSQSNVERAYSDAPIPLTNLDSKNPKSLPELAVDSVSILEPEREPIKQTQQLPTQKLEELPKASESKTVAPIEPHVSPPIPEAPQSKLEKLGSNFVKRAEPLAVAPKAKDDSDSDEREQVLSVEILLPRNRKRYSFPVEAILSACIAIVVLSAGNFVIMTRQQKIATGAALDHYMMRLANPETPAEPQPIANPRISPPASSDQSVVSGHTTTEDQEIISRFVVDSTSVISMAVHLVSRGKAPELTPEQLVHHDQAPLWINRVDADDFELTQLAGGRFIARGKAKVFVEQNRNRRRIAAKATVTGTFDAASPKILATLRLDRGTFETFPGSSAIERSDDGSERLTLSVPLSADEIEHNPFAQ